MGWFEKGYEKAERRQRYYDAAPPHEKINFHLNDGTNAILAELRLIRWILFGLFVIAFQAMFIFGPSNWLWTPFWAYIK